MARVLSRPGLTQSFKATQAAPPKSVVRLGADANTVLPVASNNERPFGLTDASAGAGKQVTVYEESNVVKAIAGASLGYSGELGVATIGVASSAQANDVATVTQLGPLAGASGVTRWAVGVALESAAAGEVFSLYVKPRQLSNLI